MPKSFARSAYLPLLVLAACSETPLDMASRVPQLSAVPVPFTGTCDVTFPGGQQPAAGTCQLTILGRSSIDLAADGAVTFTAANGDELDGVMAPAPVGGGGSGQLTIAGGTGRFAAAVGSAQFSSVATGQGLARFTFNGTLQFVPRAPTPPPPTQLTVTPQTVTLAPGGTVQFSASINGTATQAVTWSADGGTITPDGLYTAGAAPGTYVVTATSDADPSLSGSASVTIESGDPLNFSVEVRAERFGTICETDFRAGPPPLTVSAACAELPRLDKSPHPGADIVLTANGSASSVAWTASGTTAPFVLGDLPTLVGGFGNASLPAPPEGGTATVQIDPGWGSGSLFINVSISYRGEDATARFRRSSDGNISANTTVATLPLPAVASDEEISVVLSFTCDNGQIQGDPPCVGAGTMATVVISQ
jgi:hypothetical protein